MLAGPPLTVGFAQKEQLRQGGSPRPCCRVGGHCQPHSTTLAASPNLGPMRLDGIQIGDIVEVDRLGRRFHALVVGSASGGLSIQPLEPSPLQLELDTTVRD
jgi:hypothetical protein